MKPSVRVLCVLCGCFFVMSCRRAPVEAARARNLLLVTIDTLRADHVGAYGYARSQTSFLDALAASGAVFERAYAAAPITLPSHATMLTGRYPPGHGSRDNGMRMNAVPTLATELKARGFRTAAFVAAFPLDHQFGLDRGFDVYSDRLGRDASGHPANERPASQVVDEAIAWIGTMAPGTTAPDTTAPGTMAPGTTAPDTTAPGTTAPGTTAPGTTAPGTTAPGTTAPGTTAPSTQHPAPSTARFFVWIHVFEPHAPYAGDLSRAVLDRYDQEIGVANRELSRLLTALGDRASETLVVAAGDHGEAFGEHGEYAHSIFVYDTTLRVPLVMRGPGIVPRRIGDAVTLADIAPTAMYLLGFTMKEVDGIDLSSALDGRTLAAREIYAESFAPLVEFGWAPLRAVRSGPWKFIAAPKPELFDVEHDAGEQTNLVSSEPSVARSLDQRAARYSGAALATAPLLADPQAAERLRALGYASQSAIRNPQSAMSRPDPKDRRDLAARLAQVIAGELEGAALVSALEGIVRDDPRNGQAHLRLGDARLQANDCARAEAAFHAAIAAGVPSADAHLGLATCLGRRNDLAAAERSLAEARRLEPDNPVITANVGILRASKGDLRGAIESLTAALAKDPDLHEARFNLALAYAKSGRRSEAATAARELLARLPPKAPQRAEVERLLRAVQ